MSTTSTITSPVASPVVSPVPPVLALAARVAGRVLLPGTDEYAAAATPWNVAVAADHLLAVEAADAADVVEVVRFAHEHGLEVAVQATGHGAHATGRRGILVLTHLLDELTVDPVSRSARIGAGVRWAAVLEAAAPYGLAGLCGSAPHVGVVGYLTGGGQGPVARTFGWASDHVTAFDVVTGDGELRRATPTENPALFWGLRGGKGALGIVTAVETGLVPLAEMYAGALFFDGADAATVLPAWQRWSADLPEAATTSIAVLRLPPLPSVPAPLAGRPVVAVRFAWVGDPAEGERVAAPMGEVAPVVLGGLGVMPYAALGMIHADPVDPMPTHEAATLLGSLPDEAVRTLLALAGPDADCPQVIVELRQLGGALARPPAHPDALSHRDAAYTLLTIGIGVPPVVEAVAEHSAALLAAMAPWSTGGGLPNFAPSVDPDHLARVYDEATLARLGSLAETYDPHGVLIAAAALRGRQMDTALRGR